MANTKAIAFRYRIDLRFQLRRYALTESKSLMFRLEAFNTFNHAQFFGPVAVNGDFGTGTFGYVVKAAAPRLAQLALKFTF